MIKGRVSGKVWSSRRVKSLPAGALLDVETESGTRITVFDPLGCNVGEQVLITQGSVAAAYFEGQSAPVDALIIGSIDEENQAQS